jgi:hypothetical protein
MTNFIPKNDNGVATMDFECYPLELEDSWMFIHKLEDHFNYSYVFSMYKNNDFPKGTLIISPYFYHKYPDIHSLYTHQDKENGLYYGVSGWVNPKYRRRGFWYWYGIMTRVILWGNLGIHMDMGGDRDHKMEKSYQKIISSLKQEKIVENDGRAKQAETEMPRDVVFPYTWYNHRIGGKVETENKNET